MAGDCRACPRAGVRLRKGRCPACYERARHRAYRQASRVPPCALCGEPGPLSSIGVPIRHDGTPFGVAGDLCARCAGSAYAELTHGYGYRFRRLARRRSA
jgi:hypothetical protein